MVNKTGNYPLLTPAGYTFKPNAGFFDDSTNGEYSALLAILTNALAAVETGWRQYNSVDNWTTTRGNSSCDWGILQINEGSGLFTREPSLMTDTRGNIAAGAEQLVTKWNNGINGPEAVVNDQDPQRLINWYHALSSYNGGPQGAAGWRNNPNCGSEVIPGCGLADYSPSRVEIADWGALKRENYPYQERALHPSISPLL